MAPAESQNARIERKVDELTRTSIEQTAALGEIRQAIEFQAKQTAQVNELVKDKVGRVEKDLDAETTDRKKAIEELAKTLGDQIAATKATLGKIAMALFTAALGAIVTVALWVITK